MTRKYKCGICQKKFSRKYSVTRHKKSVHEKNCLLAERCHICSDFFANTNDLTNHFVHHHPTSSNGFELKDSALRR